MLIIEILINYPGNLMNTSVQSLYQRLGGESTLRQFVDHLYDFMEFIPEVRHVREMHPKSLSHAREALHMFLSGMLGGPSLYMEAFGQPRLRQRHLRFSIGNEERDQWLLCAEKAAAQLEIEPAVRDALMSELSAMANHLRNQQDGVMQRRCSSM
jgi:hemoglobin